MRTLQTLLDEIRVCTHCAAQLPLGPRPVVRAAETAKVLIIGQAPGTKVHETGVPWNDASGDRLRDWMGLSREAFYDTRTIAIAPMGFCYPGRAKSGGDNPPRPECAPLWHDRLLAELPHIELTLLVGSYAQKRYLAKKCRKTVRETVRHWADYGPDFLPLPHPSWRCTGWLKKNPWFADEVVPVLQNRVRDLRA